MPSKDGQTGPSRREMILGLLKKAQEPLKASQFAEITGVSRQVIVQDIKLLRAEGASILATSQGYVVFEDSSVQGFQRVILSQHSPEETEQELTLLVDLGVHVLDVGVEHSVYGKIFRPLKLKSRLDVQAFMGQITQNDASLLSSLTGGLHLHTLEAPSENLLDEACQVLAKEGFLVNHSV